MDLIGLVPSFGGFIYTILAFVVALSIIVAVHEYGHYIVGRWSGIHAEVFSLGFGPVIYSRVDSRGTRWQVAALPLGGYVKFLGDADAASGRDANALAGMDAKTQRNTMHGAPLWARSATVAAGPVFNLVLSILIFCGIFMVQGIATDTPTIGKLTPLPAEVQELREGDRVLAIDGRPTPDNAALVQVLEDLTPAPVVGYTVRRDGVDRDVAGPYPFPPLVGGIQPQSAAFDVDMKPGDVILAIDGQPIHAFEELRQVVGDSDGRTLLFTVWRGGEVFDIAMVPRRMDLPTSSGGFETRWLIGITGGMAFQPETRTPGPIEAIGRGAEQTYMIARTSLSGLYHIITGAISSCNLRGPIGIAETSGAAASQGWLAFIWFIAVLSTAVGLLNLFPIPVLDGGHLVFHAWEAVTGKPPSDRALRILMAIGLALIGTLMIFALTNDLFC